MKERPILFSTDMVKAILDGRKNQTRRVIKPQPNDECKWPGGLHPIKASFGSSPYGKPGDLLYVRETWKPVSYFDYGWVIKYKDDSTHEIGWLFDSESKDIESAEKYTEQFEKRDRMPWKPSIHMPKNASRIWLKVTDVRVERVQDITSNDILDEGLGILQKTEPWELIDKWVDLWDSINAERGFSWESNPWVWVVDYDVISTTGKPEKP